MSKTAINTAAGQVAPGFEKVREAFIADHPPERGAAQLCIYRHGMPVVDIWTERQDGYDGDSLTVLMSCTKGAVAVLIHMLVERGDLRLEDRIADCWPEFAVNGKAEITIAHVLTHSTGLFAFGIESGIDGKAMLDQEVSAAALAAMSPFWEPGSAFLYHFVSYGVLLAEVVRRRTGRTIGQLFAELIAQPLGLDLWIGLPEAQETRVVPHLSPAESTTADDWRRTFESLGIDPDARLPKALAQTISDTGDLIEHLKSREGRAPEVPAANAVGTARSLARMYAACVGQVDGIRLISSEVLERVRSPRTDALGPPFPLTRAGDDPQRFGLGVELPRRSMPMAGPGSFGHPGAGGRIAFANPDNGVAVAYACSAMLWGGRNPDPRWVGWNRALSEAIAR